MNLKNIACLAGLAVAASGANAQLLNPSFEIPGVPVFGGWMQFGGNITADFDNPGTPEDEEELVCDGAVAAKMFGDFSGSFNVKGLFQNLGGASVGDEWTVSVDVGHITTDALGDGARAFMSLVWVGPSGNIAEIPMDVLLPSSPTDTCIPVTFSGVAPIGTTEAQIVLGLVQEAATVDVNMDGMLDGGDQGGGAVHFDNAGLAMTNTGQQVPLYGASFEGNVFGRTFNGWEDSGGNVSLNTDVPALDGNGVAFMFGNFDGVENTVWARQGLPAAEGENWEATVNVRHASGDSIGEGNVAIMSLKFLDASGTELSDNPLVVADSTTSTDVWLERSVSAVAPAGTAQAQIFIGHVQAEPDGMGVQPGGAVFFDVASLETVEANCPADINGDGTASPADFTAWLGCFQNPASQPFCGNADVNGSGTIDPADFTAWLAAFSAGCN